VILLVSKQPPSDKISEAPAGAPKFWSIAYDIRSTGQHRTAWDCRPAEDGRLSRSGAFWPLPGHQQRPVSAVSAAWPLLSG